MNSLIMVYTICHSIKENIYILFAPLSNIPMLYIKYLTAYKVHMHAGAIRKLLYGCVYVREIKLVAYLPVHTHKPYTYLNMYTSSYSQVDSLKF